MLVLTGRPDLKAVVHKLIAGIEEGIGLPEDVVEEGAAHLEAMRALDETIRGKRGADLEQDGLGSGLGETLGGQVSGAQRQLVRFVILVTHTLHLFSGDELNAMLVAPPAGRAGGSDTGGNVIQGQGGASTPGPELDLTELFCIVSDAMPDLWTAKDMRALLDALGCDSPDEISVGCAQLRGRDIEGFAHVLLERLQTTRKRTQGGASAASKPLAVGTATPITDGGVEEGAVDASSETGDEETSSLLLASSQDRMAAVRLARGSIATCTGGPARASNRTSYRTSFAAAPALRTSYRSRAYSSRLRQATIQLAGRSEKMGRNALGVLLEKQQAGLKADAATPSAATHEGSSKQLLERARIGFAPPKRGHPQQEAAWDAPAGPERLRTWQMLYCGGAQPVVDSLCEISRMWSVKLRVEKFDW